MFKVLKLSGAALVLGLALVSQGHDVKVRVSPDARAVSSVNDSGVSSVGDLSMEMPLLKPDGNSGAVPAAASSQRQSRSSFRRGSAASSHDRVSGSSVTAPRFADESDRSLSPISGLRQDLDQVIENQNTSIGVLEGFGARLAMLESANQAAKSRSRSGSGSSHGDIAASPKAEDKGAEKSGASAPKPAFGIGLRAMLSDAGVYVSNHKVGFGATAAAVAVVGTAAYNRQRLPSVSFGGIRSWFSSKFSK